MISIITPTYNRAHLLPIMVNSVINQTFKNWELIIVDDGSTDNTMEVVQPFLKDERIKFVDRPKEREKGGNAARNYGFELAKGEFVKWLDSDDLLEPNCLERQLEVITQDKTDVVFCRSRFFTIAEGKNKIIKGPYWHEGFPLKGNFLEHFIFGRIRFSNNDGLWRKISLKDKPYFEGLKNSQEFLMIITILASGLTVSLVDEVLVLIRNHGDRMGNKRSYASFVKNQCLARYLVINELKANKIKNLAIYNYLNKSIIYYLAHQVKKGEFAYFFTGLNLFSKSIIISYFK